ncbi:4-(cytidine 5'-diphospho)-2-C-methyl-D-erythritol kinase [bacterium]|nr:4-(cytidine 5'-diphospho)-2-C-methyl-D-erythritol kinase [candidate division CSSED10-310 bacterium]
MKILARAKINIVLRVLYRRSDGYHEVESIMQTVGLADAIELTPNSRGTIRLECSTTDTGLVKDNLAFRAARLFLSHQGIARGVDIELKKSIPIGGGLGGGSSDAAAVLLGLNRIFKTELPVEVLRVMAAELGSDVPFFIGGGTALVTGRGERITPLPFVGNMFILLINPGFSVSTAMVYSSLNLDLTTPERVHNILPVFSRGNVPLVDVKAAVQNDLQATVVRLYPQIAGILDWFREHDAVCAAVSGSGGTVFGIFHDRDRAIRAADDAQRMFPWCVLTETVADYGF